ncbi:MAG: T9SS type A sorting domain-containing protein [Bacteroidales bacterium]|nr:T9SS type A sorting domain-containing protein [Bacteroidales bacterium]
MLKQLLSAIFVLSLFQVNAQQLLLLDRDHGNRIVNDSVVTVTSTDPEIIDLTMYFTMKNNTDQVLSLNLRKTVHMMADSTIDYFCFGIKCWPETDTTNYPDTLLPGAEDYTFASHVVHYRRFDMPPLPSGFSSITYTIYDDTSFPEPVEASVTVNYHHQSNVGINKKDIREALVYPNPATGIIHVISGDGFTGEANVKIFNSLGLMVKEFKGCADDGRLTIPVDELQTGCYFGRIENSEKEAITFRFIK